MTSKETVFVTGASGFIALHIIDLLLAKNYKVMGSVRSETQGESLVKDFQAKYPGSEISYVIVREIGAPNAFDNVLQTHPEIKYVLHTASPLTFGQNKSAEEFFIRPAIEGALNILKGVKKFAPQVKNVVMTSSHSAIINSKAPNWDTLVHTEETWNPVTLEEANENEGDAYNASKTYAEQAAWKFVETEKPHFLFTTVNPPYVLGPQVIEEALNYKPLRVSAQIIQDLLDTKPDVDVPKLEGLLVDVRDVALLHVQSLADSKLAGQRLFPVSGHFSNESLLLIINEKIPQLRGKIAKGDVSKIEQSKVREEKYDNSKTESLTGLKPISIEKSIVDSVEQFIKFKSN